MTEKIERGPKKFSTLCWDCDNACGGCSWSDGSFTPVKGWTAKKELQRYNGKPAGYSYTVMACPEFKADDRIIYADSGDRPYILELDTGKRLYSMEEMVDHVTAETGRKRKNVLRNIEDSIKRKGKKSFAVYGIRYAQIGNVPPRSVFRSVKRVKTGERFQSLQELARFLIKSGISSSRSEINLRSRICRYMRIQNSTKKIIMYGEKFELEEKE